MIADACVCQSNHLQAPQGLQASQSAQALRRKPRTVASWLAHAHFQPRTPSQRPSTWDPFTPALVRLLERSPSAAAQVFQRCRPRAWPSS